MKYNTFRNDVVSILHSAEYELNLQFFDKDENVTLNINDIKWIYIKNYNIMIEIKIDEDVNNYSLSIWKNNDSLTPDLNKIFKQLRHLTTINGIDMEIKVFNNLDKTKIYNMVKKEISKEETISENIQLKKILDITNSIKDASDFYLTEQLSQGKKDIIYKVLEETIKGTYTNNSSNLFKDIDIHALCDDMKNKHSVKELSKYHLSETQRNELEIISKYVKNCFSNSFIPEYKETYKVLPNMRIYKEISTKNINNLTEAYNQLLKITNGVENANQIYFALRKHKICETYNVSRSELLNLWLSRDEQNPIKPVEMVVVEHSNGTKDIFTDSISSVLEKIVQ